MFVAMEPHVYDRVPLDTGVCVQPATLAATVSSPILASQIHVAMEGLVSEMAMETSTVVVRLATRARYVSPSTHVNLNRVNTMAFVKVQQVMF